MIKIIFKIALKFALFKTDGVLSFVRKTFFLAIFSLTVSIFSLILLDSINNGYKDRLGKRLLKIESDIEINANNISRNIILDLVDIVESGDASVNIVNKNIKHSNNVKSVLGKYQVLLKDQGVLRFGSKAEGVNVVSIDESFLSISSGGFKSYSIYDQFYNSNQYMAENEVVLGFSLKEELGLEVGDKVYLFRASDIISNSFKKNIQSFVVKAFFKSGNPIEDSHTIIVDDKVFFNFFQNSKVKNIKIFLNDSSRQEEIKNLIYNNIEEPIYVTTFNQKFYDMSYSLDQIFDIISIIVLFFILLSLLNIVSSVNLIVESKARQVKFLKLIGIKLPYLSMIFISVSLISIIISFSFAYLLSEFVLLIQNNYQIFSISEDVYVISELKGLIDYRYTLLFLVYLIISGFLLSLIFSYKTIYKKVKI